MKFLILGLGLSGTEVAKYLLDKSYEVFAFDDDWLNIQNKLDIQDLLEKGLQIVKNRNLSGIDQFVLSPGIHPNHPLVRLAKKLSIRITSEIEIAFLEIAKKKLQIQCIGITGTNGKSTLAKLITHILNQSQKKAVCLGNIGKSVIGYADQISQNEILVIELSSFQLETLFSKCLDWACIINITPDHLDRYLNFKKYAKAKLSIQNRLKKSGELFLSKQVAKDFSEKVDCDMQVVQDFALEGYHLLIPNETISFAYAICRKLGISKKQFIQSLQSFQTIEHRIEFVAKIDEVFYYNDSKATNPFAVLEAVKLLKQNIVLIAGGFEKNVDFILWKKAFGTKVRKIFAIGQTAKKIRNDLGSEYDVEIVHFMHTAIEKARKTALQGEAVVLSPGCASFDQFENFEIRGRVFKEIICEMAQKKRLK